MPDVDEIICTCHVSREAAVRFFGEGEYADIVTVVTTYSPALPHELAHAIHFATGTPLVMRDTRIVTVH